MSTKFNLELVENKEIYTTMKPMPYIVKTDKDEIEDKCELCLDLSCCPEHCCDVSLSPLLTIDKLIELFTVTVGHMPVYDMQRLSGE